MQIVWTYGAIGQHPGTAAGVVWNWSGNAPTPISSPTTGRIVSVGFRVQAIDRGSRRQTVDGKNRSQTVRA